MKRDPLDDSSRNDFYELRKAMEASKSEAWNPGNGGSCANTGQAVGGMTFTTTASSTPSVSFCASNFSG